MYCLSIHFVTPSLLNLPKLLDSWNVLRCKVSGFYKENEASKTSALTLIILLVKDIHQFS